MSVRIWEQRRYVADGLAKIGQPENSDVAEAPYNKDTLVREITRFTGWTQEYYAKTGECEIEIHAGQVQAEDIAKGRIIEVDGLHFVIEDYVWRLEDGGYSCIVSGRDMGGRLDNEIPLLRNSSGVVSGDMGDVEELARSFFGDQYHWGVEDTEVYAPVNCGWYRDSERKPADGWVKWEIEGDYSLTDTFNANGGGNLEIVSYGALLRYMAAFYDLGYKFRFKYDETTGLHDIQLVLYKPDDSGTVFKSASRGVSNFEYSFSSRDTVNASIACGKSRHYREGQIEQSAEDPIFPITYLVFKEQEESWAKVASNWSIRAVDYGELSEEDDTGWWSARTWLSKQEDVFQNDIEQVSFSYDNSGAYRYGEHFTLGSKVSIVDSFLNLGVTKRLYGVKRTYDAGEVVKYDFEFGDQSITSADKLLKRFAELDRKNYSV